MMRRGLAPFLGVLAWALAAAPAAAHVGSPNVFYDGGAGPYAVRVVVRAPAVVPGLAEVTVRLRQGTAEEITVQPIQWKAGTKGAPPPDEAARVPGAPGVWSAQIWLMRSSSYSLRVRLKGPTGEGTTLVPVTVMPTQVLRMDKGMGIALAALGLFLFAGAVTLVGAAVRESRLPPGEEAGDRQRVRARIATGLAVVVYALALWGGKSWWDSVDRQAQERVFRPFTVHTAALLVAGRPVLEMKIDDWRSKEWSPLIPDHGKLMHLFLLREPGLDAFAHVHPVPNGKDSFVASLPPLPPGVYRAYADVVHETGFPQTLVDKVTIPAALSDFGESPGSPASDPDDSWRIAEPVSPTASSRPQADGLADGSTMLWHQQPLTADRETTLRFEVRTPDGRPARLEPYMGMLSHAVISRDDGVVFVHLHPMGSISMAAQQAFERKAGEPGAMPAMAAMDHGVHAGGEVSFPYAFPQPGRYRLWVQVKRGGRVMTAVFDAWVKPRRPAA